MSKHVKENLLKYGEWIYRSAVLLALGAALWVQNNFASKEDVKALGVKIDTTNQLLTEVKSAHEVTKEKLKVHQSFLGDHENRLRVVESKTRAN